MLLFACPGVPRSTPAPGGTVEGLKHAHSLDIGAMEIEWVQSVPGNVERMEAIRETAAGLGMALTVHAPYFVNLNASDAVKLVASKKRILAALTMGQIAGVRSVCVHAAFYQGSTSQKATDNVRRATEDILKRKDRFFPDVNLAYETMGKPTQWGTLDEVLAVSKEFGLYPCVDPAHMHARSGGAWNTAEEWNAMLDAYEEALGAQSLRSMHMHFSGIAYGPKGEKHHLPLRESDARWKDFLDVLKKRNVGGVLVCESPLMEQDTVLLQSTFAAIVENA
ncbi:MAG: Endonuclease IV [Candidatus Peregrinibacteria bacterium Gr01-1014_25]|nr:MAG: Endonuclease IV [Candidatus Peregrinibacteria bacterium Gr01-1014_25]